MNVARLLSEKLRHMAVGKFFFLPLAMLQGTESPYWAPLATHCKTYLQCLADFRHPCLKKCEPHSSSSGGDVGGVEKGNSAEDQIEFWGIARLAALARCACSWLPPSAMGGYPSSANKNPIS